MGSNLSVDFDFSRIQHSQTSQVWSLYLFFRLYGIHKNVKAQVGLIVTTMNVRLHWMGLGRRQSNTLAHLLRHKMFLRSTDKHQRRRFFPIFENISPSYKWTSNGHPNSWHILSSIHKWFFSALFSFRTTAKNLFNFCWAFKKHRETNCAEIFCLNLKIGVLQWSYFLLQ